MIFVYPVAAYCEALAELKELICGQDVNPDERFCPIGAFMTLMYVSALYEMFKGFLK